VWAALALLSAASPQDRLRPQVDHHQHFFSPAAAKLSSGITPVAASDLVRLLDAAGIPRAVVLSLGYQYANPNRPVVEDEYARVREENDWTSVQVAEHPDRLRGFCGLNPLEDYALAELARCAETLRLGSGLKLHFGNSDVDLQNAGHVAQLRRVFRAANDRGMAIVVHLRSSITRKRPYGASVARVFLEDVVTAAPDVTIQIAHLAGAGGYDDPLVDEALAVFVEAILHKDSRMARVYFDVSGIAGLGRWQEKAGVIAARIRQLGVDRVLYGSDGTAAENTPARAWAAFRQLPLTDDEFRAIAGNVAPYLR
jgi:predicted TIM-barrel fold metal-dependent hydrolase